MSDLGPQELLLLGLLGGGLIAVVLLLGFLLRRAGRQAVLQAENRRLREENARRK
jgi:hypothetical protein